MYQIDKTKACRILLDELGLKPAVANATVNEFPALTDVSLIKAVDDWLDHRAVGDLEIEGISIKDVMQKQRCNFLAAIANLNLLLEPDVSAEERESIIRILKKPAVRM